jgi:hypothetical protein
MHIGFDTTAYSAGNIRCARSSRGGSNESRLVRNGQILHRVLEGVVVIIAIPFFVFLLTRTGILIVGRFVLKIKLRYMTGYQNGRSGVSEIRLRTGS